MAEWTKLCTSLLGHIKVEDLMTAADIEEPQAMGHLSLLWLRTLMHKPDGNITSWEPKSLERYLRWKGPQGALYAALMDTGWIVRKPDGDVVLNDWSEYCAHKTASDQTKKWREQKRAQREREKARKADMSADTMDSPVSAIREREIYPPPHPPPEEGGKLLQLQKVSAAQPAEVEEKRAPLAVDLTARASVDLAQALAYAGHLGATPQLGHRQRSKLIALCGKGLTRDELASAVSAAKVASGNKPPSMGLVVSKVDLHRQDAEAGGVPAAVGDRLSWKDRNLVEGSQIANSPEIRKLLDKAKG